MQDLPRPQHREAPAGFLAMDLGRWRWLAAADDCLARWPRFGAFSCGVLTTLAMPPVFAWPVLFLTFYGLVRLLDVAAAEAVERRRAQRLFVTGWLFGLGYFLTGLYWISASLFVEPNKFLWLLPFSATLIPAGLAVFHGLAAAALVRIWKGGAARIVALALALTAAEWLRGHVFTGLPWNTLGYALTAPPVLMQSASLVGSYALTFVTVVIFALPAAAAGPGMASRRGWHLAVCLAVPFALLAGLSGYGVYRLSLAEPEAVAGVRLRLMQPNVSQNMKWRSENRGDIFRSYLDLSRRNPQGEDDGLAGITHVIWPESAIPFLLLDSQPALEAVAGLLPDGTSLVTGAIRAEEIAGTAGMAPQRRVFNSVLDLCTLEVTDRKLSLSPKNVLHS